MACRTGDACGLTDTRSGASRWANHSAVIRLTIDALEAWCPPTFTPERFTRTRLAWWTIEVASQSTRRWTSSSTARSSCGCEEVGAATPRQRNGSGCEDGRDGRARAPRQVALGRAPGQDARPGRRGDQGRPRRGQRRAREAEQGAPPRRPGRARQGPAALLPRGARDVDAPRPRER